MNATSTKPARRWWKVNGGQGRAPRREAEQCFVNVHCRCGQTVGLTGDNDLKQCRCGCTYRLSLTVWMREGEA